MSAATFSDWFAPRRRVLMWIAMGYTSFFVCFGLCWAFAPRIAPIGAPTDRLLLAVQLGALPAAVLMGVLQMLWRVQEPDPEAENPLLGKESERFQINQRVMTNTVEQTLIFMPMLLALAVRMAPEQTWLLPVLVGMWTAGRLMFWAGYNVGSVQRAIGMDWTTGVSVVTALLLVATLF